MQPTRLGALAAGACAARTCPRRWRVSGWHDQPRRTAPSAVVHSGTDSDKRAFGGDGTHRQHGLAGRRHSCGNSATSCCELDDDLWGRWRRGERHAMEWVQRRKGVSVVAQRRGEGGGATALPVEERSSSGWRGTLRQWRQHAQTRAVGRRSNSEATAQRRWCGFRQRRRRCRAAFKREHAAPWWPGGRGAYPRGRRRSDTTVRRTTTSVAVEHGVRTRERPDMPLWRGRGAWPCRPGQATRRGAWHSRWRWRSDEQAWCRKRRPTSGTPRQI
jgi:hypothetical protein